MVDLDSAFLWESEALRNSPPRRIRPTHHARREPTRHDDATVWVTLRRGHEVTGVPVSTLRKWAMGGNVPTYMEDSPVGQLRMISLNGVYERAEQLGRRVDGQPPAQPVTPRPAVPQSEPSHPSPSAKDENEVPPGTTLVPLDAWNKMLRQLGNLHEAGQQLAEASARAAKAETEAAFLKERLAELRAELAEARDPNASTSEPEPPEQTRPSSSMGVLRQVYASWRRGRRA